MSFYGDLAATADRSLQKFGASVTLLRTAAGVYDPASGTTTTPKPVAYVGVGVALNYTAQDMKNSLIQQGDQKLYISALGMVEPRPGDTVQFGGSAYTVVDSKPLAPAGVAVLFEVQVRGADAP